MTTEDDRDAARLLEPLRRLDPGPVSGVDIGRAMRTGRRTVRTRRAAGGIAGVTTALGLAALVAFPLTSPGTETREEFSATVQEFDIGSAAGFTPLTYETGVGRQRAVLTAPELDDTDAVVTMYAPDRLPRVDGADWRPEGETVDAVGDGEALLLTEPVLRDGAVELAWRWRDDAWGFVSMRGPDADTDRARRVALGVTPDAEIPVVPAVTPPEGLIPNAELTGTLRSIGSVGRPELINQSTYTVGGDPDSWITLGLRRPGGEDSAYPTTVGDRPAHVQDDQVIFMDGSGLFVEVGEDFDIGMSLTDLAAEIGIDPDVDWTSTPPLSSPTADGASTSVDDGDSTGASDEFSESGSPGGGTAGSGTPDGTASAHPTD